MKSVRTARKAATNLKRAGRNLHQSARLLGAAGGVLAARSRLAAAGDHSEIVRMVPEKAVAFTAAGLAFAQHATRAATEISLNAGSEWKALHKKAVALAGARNPVEAAVMQGSYMWTLWTGMASQSVALGTAMLRAQRAVTAPIVSTARANAKRLSR